jgi:site-specific DNA recombinase
MKRAILYIRVSTDEQADKGYSLAHQQERLEKYCALQGYEVIALYNDDHSAKTFERPQFKKLLEYLKRNKNKADLLLFTKWDRFSRNAGDAYGMINTLNKQGIEPQAIDQPLDLNVPENKLMLAFYLAAPEVENDRRALNIIVGLRKARREGRFVGLAPKGYKNVRNEKDIARIEIDKELENGIRWSFIEIAKGVKTIEDIRKEAVEHGLIVSKFHFWMMIRNPLYYGMIEVPKYKDEDYTIVEGQHKGIITKEVFYKVQDVINGRKRNMPTTNMQRDEFPLRGFLECRQCGRPLTASASKGNGGYYNYYHCKFGCNERIKAEVINKKIVEILQDVSSKSNTIELMKKGVKTIFKNSNKFKQDGAQKVKLDIEKLQNRLVQAQQLLLDGDISVSEYKSIKETYEPELKKLTQHQSDLASLQVDLQAYMQLNLELLENLGQQYVSGDVHTKQLLLSSTFTKKLVFENNRCRTISFNEVVKLTLNIDKRLSDSKTRTARLKNEQFVEVEDNGFEPMTSCMPCKRSTN